MKTQSQNITHSQVSDLKLNHQALDLDHCKKILDICVSTITTLGLLIAGCYSLVEYINQQKTRQQDKTLDLYMKQIDVLRDTRTDLNILYHPKELKQLLTIIGNPKSDPKETTKKYHEFILKFSQDKYPKIKVMIDFYEGVANCVETKVCDQKTAEYLFKKEGQEFFLNFTPVICQLRHEYQEPTIAMKLEQFYNNDNRPSAQSNVCDYLAQIK